MIDRIKIGLIILFFELSSKFALSYTPPDFYIIVCVAFSVLIIPCYFVIGWCSLSKDMAGLALVNLFIQFFGLYSYHQDLPSMIYNNAIFIFVIIQVARLLIVRSSDARGANQNGGGLILHRDVLDCCTNYHEKTK